MSKDSDKIILLGVIGLGAFWLMQRRPVSGTLAPSQRQGSTSAAGWAQAIAGGIAGLFGGASRGQGQYSGPGYEYVARGGNIPGNTEFVGPMQNAPAPDFSVPWYASSANDAVAFSPPNNVDPWAFAQYIG